MENIFYFLDGASSQYKNKFNFINLVEHENDFAVKAEWHFVATAHAKGACDGVRGVLTLELPTIEVSAYRASLQRINGGNITTPKKFYVWAKDYFQTISFSCSTEQEHVAQKFT